eukprot:TRINITY_DN712_c0_g1_i1.p1 TRINITY_DN712_c0_g1~~TRINITY_DN712_c0_g1_i1.p1  ORF type:complete len:332 (-),score=54.71 TRINITY_DN712_c0_g1_i1:188-1126(-)
MAPLTETQIFATLPKQSDEVFKFDDMLDSDIAQRTLSFLAGLGDLPFESSSQSPLFELQIVPEVDISDVSGQFDDPMFEREYVDSDAEFHPDVQSSPAYSFVSEDEQPDNYESDFSQTRRPVVRKKATARKATARRVTVRSSSSAFHDVTAVPTTGPTLGRWSDEESSRLREAVSLYAGNWKQIASHVGTRTSQQCLHRWRKSVQPGVSRARWSSAEDKLLTEAVRLHGSHWTKVREGVPGRTDVQCRERWVNIIDPAICKEPWTPAEDAQLRAAVRDVGVGKWSQCAQYLTARRRTDYACRKRWEKLYAHD